MKAFSKIAVLLLSVLTCGAAQATESIEVKVAGRLAPVNSCVPTLSSSQLDYGVLKASDLNHDKQTALPEKILTVTVDCQSWINGLTIGFPDSKAADAIRDPGVVDHPLCPQGCGDAAFGLGRDGQGRPIGALFLVDKGADIDGKPATWDRILGPKDGAGAKARLGLFGPHDRPGDSTRSYGYLARLLECRPVSGVSSCTNGQHFSIPIGINPIIDSKDRAIADDVKLDGAFSIEIHTL